MAFGPDFHPRLIAQKIRAAGLWWLCPAVQSAAQVVEAVLVEHDLSILPFKPPNWVVCHQPATLKELVVLMEVYASAEAGVYLNPKAWKGRMDHKPQGQADQGPRCGREQQGRSEQGPCHRDEALGKPMRESCDHGQ